MSDIENLGGALPLDRLVREADVVGGFEASPGFIRMFKNVTTQQAGDMVLAPALRLRFESIKGERWREVCIPLPMILPLIMELSTFGTGHTNVAGTDFTEVTG